MNEKKADNFIISRKEKINKIDDMLEEEKKKIRKLENIQENLNSLNMNMSKCLNVFSKSIKGANTESVLNYISNYNDQLLNKTDEKINSSLKETKKEINKLYLEKENVIKSREQE